MIVPSFDKPRLPLTEQVSKELLENTHTFPCPYTFKLIGSEENGFEASGRRGASMYSMRQ